MGLNLLTNLPMFVYTFKAMSRHWSLEEYLVFVGIRAELTSFSPFTLGRALSPLPYCDPPPVSAPINTACPAGIDHFTSAHCTDTVRQGLASLAKHPCHISSGRALNLCISHETVNGNYI